MSVNQNNAKVVATCNQRLVALNKLVAAKAAMKINGQQMKLSEVIALYQACLDTRAALVTQRAAFEKALAARDGAEITRRAADAGLKAWVTAEFGLDSPEAREFGFAPRKVAETTVETKAVALEKLRATRKARMTMGKRQKKKVTGTIVVPTVPADPATAQAAAPAANAPASTNGAPNGASPANGVAVSH